MSKLRYTVFSVREYRGGAEDKLDTYIRIDSLLVIGNEELFLDSTVCTMQTFSTLHPILQKMASEVFSYDYDIYNLHVQELKKSLSRLLQG
jgi:hypothetical protein